MEVGSRSASDLTSQCLKLVHGVETPRQDRRHALPRTRRRACVRVTVELVQPLGAEPQEGTHPLIDTLRIEVLDRVVEVSIDLKEHQAILEMRRHVVGARTIRRTVASGHDHPAFRQMVRPDAALIHDLRCDVLVGNGCLWQFVEEQNATTLSRHPVGTHADHGAAVLRGDRPATQFPSIVLREGQDAALHVHGSGHILDDGGLAQPSPTDQVGHDVLGVTRVLQVERVDDGLLDDGLCL